MRNITEPIIWDDNENPDTGECRINVDCQILIGFANEIKTTVMSNRFQRNYDPDWPTLDGRPNKVFAGMIVRALDELFELVGLDAPYMEALEETERVTREECGKSIAFAQARLEAAQGLAESRFSELVELRKRIDAAESNLTELISGMLSTEVTHSQREGQIRLLATMVRTELRAAKFAPTDIPF